MAVARARVVFSGYVQGVGFRFTARSLAAPRPVTGWVRNRFDGTVELEAQGDRPAVEAYLDALRDEMRGNITGEELAWIAPADGETGFGIWF